MASNTPVVSSELASILATLSQFAPLTKDPQTNSFETEHSHVQFGNAPPAPLFDQEQVKSTPQHRNPQPDRPLIDPASITEWSAGLRCVSKIASQNSQFGDSIKRMIHDQRKHEMQWYASRQALKQEQARRGLGSTQIRSILKFVGGAAPADEQKPQTADELENELIAFDQKIHRAQTAMSESMTRELKVLGVPFFGTQAVLILSPGAEADGQSQDSGRPKWSQKVTMQEMDELKRRMIRYLEDMYKD